MKATIFAIVFSLFSASCNSVPTHSPPVQHDTPSCGKACAKLSALGCEEAKDSIVTIEYAQETSTSCVNADEDAGVCTITCETLCIDSQNNGAPLNPSCILNKVTKCSDMQELDTFCK